MTLVDYQIQYHCHDQSFAPQWWNIKAWAYKLKPLPRVPMVSPYRPNQVNSHSYDVVIGDRIKIAKKNQKGVNFYTDNDGIVRWEKVELPFETQFTSFDLTTGKTFWLTPDDFILTETLEEFHIPRNISAVFALKSSRGREGYEHLLAAFIDGGWHGSRLTLELKNASPNPIPVYKGLKIGQIVFSYSDHPIKAYDERGRYNGDNGVQESKG